MLNSILNAVAGSSTNLLVLLGAAAVVAVLLLVVSPVGRFADRNYR